MNEEKGQCCQDLKNCNQRQWSNPGNGVVYGLGFIGAAIYFISNATTFWIGVLGFLKAIVWPAFLVYYAFRSLLG